MAALPAFAQAVTPDRLGEFDALIDVRSPAEFDEDHIPGAVNLPVLDDEQRARVGTMYAQQSPFAARKLGAALVARNIASHLEVALREHPRHWRPLVYCWRGGQRSGAMTTVLQQVGWAARQLDGGYRSYRRKVLADLEQMPPRHAFVVLHGPTGSGKTALLEALQGLGGQVLNLEAYARHRGSVLGGQALSRDPAAPSSVAAPGGGGVQVPAAPSSVDAAGSSDSPPDDRQPGQKAFESQIWDALRSFDRALPVFVESESRRIGKRSIPPALFDALTASPCLRISATIDARVAHLLERYGDIYRNPAALRRQLDFFSALHGHRRVDDWRRLVDMSQWADLARQLVLEHYDPAYHRGGNSLYRLAGAARVLEMGSLEQDAIMRVAQEILQQTGTRNAK